MYMLVILFGSPPKKAIHLTSHLMLSNSTSDLILFPYLHGPVSCQLPPFASCCFSRWLSPMAAVMPHLLMSRISSAESSSSSTLSSALRRELRQTTRRLPTIAIASTIPACPGISNTYGTAYWVIYPLPAHNLATLVSWWVITASTLRLRSPRHEHD